MKLSKIGPLNHVNHFLLCGSDAVIGTNLSRLQLSMKQHLSCRCKHSAVVNFFMRRMYGHTILDATSTGKDEAGLLALHLPGVLIRRDVDSGQETVTVIRDDTLYHCREKTGP